VTAVFVSPEAESDLNTIALSIATEQPAAARRFILSFKDLRDQLALTPHLGRVQDIGTPQLDSLRTIPVPGFLNHLVFYRVSDDGSRVDVWRILDGRRDLPLLLGEWTKPPEPHQ
jgi:plasmid stabilization system protein ParE